MKKKYRFCILNIGNEMAMLQKYWFYIENILHEKPLLQKQCHYIRNIANEMANYFTTVLHQYHQIINIQYWVNISCKNIVKYCKQHAQAIFYTNIENITQDIANAKNTAQNFFPISDTKTLMFWNGFNLINCLLYINLF